MMRHIPVRRFLARIQAGYKSRTPPRRHGGTRCVHGGVWLVGLGGASAVALRLRRHCDVRGVFGRLEVRVLGYVVEHDGDVSGNSCERNLARLAALYEPPVRLAEDVVASGCAYRRHVERFGEIAPASLRTRLLLDGAALVVERGVPAHLGYALGVELSDVRTVCKNRAREAGADALDRLEASVEFSHVLILGNGLVALDLDLRNLLVELGKRAFDVPLRVPVCDVLKLIVHDRPGLHEVLAHADRLFQAFVRLGSLLDEMELFVLERCRVVSDHLAVDLVRLLDAPLGFRKAPRSPCVEAHGSDAFREAFVGERLLIGASRLEADDGPELCRLLDQLCPAGLDVSDVFFLSVWVAYVEMFLADIDAHYHFGRVHDILSLSSSYRDLVSRMPYQPYRLWLMTKRRCPDSPAMYMHLGGNGLTAAARVGWPSFPGILFASACAYASPSPNRQERSESISQLD